MNDYTYGSQINLITFSVSLTTANISLNNEWVVIIGSVMCSFDK